MGNRRIVEALLALAWFWIWAAHVATGILDGAIGMPGGRKSSTIRWVDSVIDTLLTEPLGRPLATAVLFLIGIGLASYFYRSRKQHVSTRRAGWE